MKTPEDEAFDELARKQGAWGGGFTAKRQAAMDKINSEFHEEYIKYRTAFPKEYTAPQPVQEPAAMDDHQTLEALKYAASKGYGRIARENSAPFTIKEASAQPAQEQRPWVELTDEEMEDIRASFSGQFLETWEFAYKVQVATQAKLKERNHGT